MYIYIYIYLNINLDFHTHRTHAHPHTHTLSLSLSLSCLRAVAAFLKKVNSLFGKVGLCKMLLGKECFDNPPPDVTAHVWAMFWRTYRPLLRRAHAWAVDLAPAALVKNPPSSTPPTQLSFFFVFSFLLPSLFCALVNKKRHPPPALQQAYFTFLPVVSCNPLPGLFHEKL